MGTGIISNADALCATNCLHAMLEYAANNCRRALIETNTIGFKVLAASCREYVRAVGISEAATFRDSFERLHATCCKASQDGASSCTQEINVLLLDSVLPLIERTSWEAVSSHKGVEAYLLGVIRNVGEYADNYPSSIPRKQLLITTLWRYACAMREARSSRINALRVLSILAGICQSGPEAANVHHNIAEICIECFDAEESAQEREHLDRGASSLRSAWPCLPAFPPSEGSLEVLTSCQQDPAVPLRSLYLHLRILLRLSRIGDAASMSPF